MHTRCEEFGQNRWLVVDVGKRQAFATALCLLLTAQTSHLPTQEEAKQLLVTIKMLVSAPAAEEEEEAIKFKATFGQVLARRMRKDAFLDGRGWA